MSLDRRAMIFGSLDKAKPVAGTTTSTVVSTVTSTITSTITSTVVSTVVAGMTTISLIGANVITPTNVSSIGSIGSIW